MPMNNNYELYYATMDEKQVEEFAYNITTDLINKYVANHQAEFKKWKEFEHLKEVVKNGLDINKTSPFNQRKQLFYQLKEVKLTNEQ